MTGSSRCQLCGRQLSAETTCSRPVYEFLLKYQLPSHCCWCHCDAVHAGTGYFYGPLLGVPWAQPAPDYRGEWERAGHGKQIDERKP